MNTRVEEITAILDTISIEIVVPLRRKVIDETAFSKLFELMDELQSLLCDQNFMPKKLVKILFHVYTQLDMQAEYVRSEEVKKEFITYLTIMRSKMRGIFEERVPLNADMKEISLKDIMESSGITDQREVIDKFKKLYE
ncbi:hypothetical protein [Paenibacillus typhae]|uniref:Uncharacterized protein n=1 Tax=Paenibacillus typhae TaxID=1174501 RepID=A0A1G9ACZ5_9BACL|nr:hypothetical protein [Paenibacillus typhae]MBY0013280.1 hypothetical protein [Paenibacillus typhae]SDK25262.1 hypothetical protein SAMN05216192_13620 [Paenibacillus typhae]